METDNYTSDTTPTLTGTAEAGATVTLRDGSTVLGTTVANGGAWSFTTGVLGQGTHSFSAMGTDKAGNVSPQSSTLTVAIDTDAPAAPSTADLEALSDTGSLDTDNHTSDTTPTLTGTAEADAAVTLRDGATVLGTAVANGAGAWSFTTGVLGQGTHFFSATATDKAGNVSTPSSTLTVTIDTAVAAPSTPDLTASDDTGSLNTDNNTSNRTRRR